jgi:hypothetical protein
MLDLLGPFSPFGETLKMGGIFARYESEFLTYAEKHAAEETTSWEWYYYDRARVLYAYARRSGDISYRERAHKAALAYRRQYVEANDYGVSAHWSFVTGLATHFLLAGDEASRTAVGRIADSFNVWYYMDALDGVVPPGSDNTEPRIQARALEAYLTAHLISAPSFRGYNDEQGKSASWPERLRFSLNAILSSQQPTGEWPGSGAPDNSTPFMNGILHSVLIDYYERFEADPRIPVAIRRNLDWMWANMWVPKSKAFRYHEFQLPGESADVLGPAPDLNMLIVDGFGFVFQTTGDRSYVERGDLVFRGGVESAWLVGAKQFNQSYTTSYRYLGYRSAR